MNIITGYRGEAHITADQIRDQNQGCFGDGSYILDVGSKLEATAISATSVQLADGIISHQGCTASIPYGSTEAVTIGNGTQGMQRIDLIVARYTKDAGTGVEDMEFAVIQGTPAASNPSTPSYNQGSIHAGDSPVDMPLFEVALDGISIDSITQVASVVKTQAETDAEISALNSSLGRLTSKAGSVLTQQQNLTTSPATVTCNGSSYNTGSVFTLVSSDGGFRCSRQGMVRVTGYIHVTGVTSGDEIGLSAGVYSGGWVYQSYSMRSKTVTVSIDIFVPVSENQIVYIRASNNSGARGAIDSAQLAVEWLSA